MAEHHADRLLTGLDAAGFRQAGCRSCRAHAHAGADFTLPGAKAHYPPDLSIEPTHLDIDLFVDVPARTASGTVTHTLTGRRHGADTVRLHAVDFEDLAVTDEAGQAVPFSYDGRVLVLRFETPFTKDEARKVAIRYRVEEPVTGLFFSGPDDTDPQRALYAATDHETERARHWLPTIDLPACRPTLAWHLRARKDLTILANGAHQGEDQHEDGTKTVHWTLEQRCPSYLTCFAIGDFVEFEDGEFEGIPVAAYTSKQFTSADLERSFGRTRDMLAWMSKKLDFAFPFPKYYQFALPGFGGAMENISLVSWDDIFVLDETMGREWTWLVDQINLHEMAHSYFGDLIVCRDYGHAWLKESWATYMESLWLEDSKGEDELLFDVLRNIDNYVDEADNAYQRPIMTRTFNHSWQMYDRHLYPGGASRLHMLRKELGDETFFEGVQLYVKRFAHKTVETDDFRKCLEEVCGRSLVRWFDQWILSAGYPHVKAGYEYDKKRGVAKITVEQAQVDEKKGKQPFCFSLDLLVVTKQGEHTERVEVDAAKHIFELPVKDEPTSVEIDPHGRTVMKLEFDPGAEMLRTQLTGAKTIVGRVRAARTLCKTGKRKNLAAVRDSYGKQAFWGVRLAAAQAMGKATADEAVSCLADMIRGEQDGLVLEGAIRAAAGIRDARIRDVLADRLDQGIELYRATGAALEVLGNQRDAAPLERLEAATGLEDPYGWQAQSAYRALAATRKVEVLDRILDALPPGGAPDRVRPMVAIAAAGLGRQLERRHKTRIGEALVDRLRDGIERVRARAVPALGALGWGGAVGPLSGYRSRLSEQEQVDVDRAIQQIRGAAKGGGKASEKDLEELRDEVRKLEGRLMELESRQESADESKES